jgi:hypothetical protein
MLTTRPPMPLAVQSKAWVCGPSLLTSNPAGGHCCLSLVIVGYCKVQVYASGRSLVQRSPTECNVSECDSE